MKLSRTATYAVQAVCYLAKNEKMVGHQAAKALRIPEGFLLRILVALSRARILNSIKGPNGGYSMGRNAREISLLDIVEAVEGPMKVGPLALDSKDKLASRLSKVCEESNEMMRKKLASVRIPDLAK